MAKTQGLSVEIGQHEEAAPRAPLPYPEHDVASNARRAHDVISVALKEARAIRKHLEGHGDPAEAAQRLGAASNHIGSAAFFLREAIAIKVVNAKSAPSARDLIR
jgi:hypothetical protein